MHSVIALLIIALVGLGLLVVLHRLIIPWTAKRRVERMLAKSGDLDPRVLEREENGVMESDARVVRVQSKAVGDVTFLWSEVIEMYAYKRDLFTVDLICIGFRMSDGSVVEVNEEMCGYHDLKAKLPVLLPEYSEAWFTDVAFPAFAENHRVVWRRA